MKEPTKQDMRPQTWKLAIRLNGEWEECQFPNVAEALATIKALAADYREALGTVTLSAAPARQCYWQSRNVSSEPLNVAQDAA